MNDTHQRFLDLINHETTSPEGMKILDNMRNTAIILSKTAQNMIEEGQTLTPTFFFFIQEENEMRMVIFPIHELSKDMAGQAIRMIAETSPVVAVCSVMEAYAIWEGATNEDYRMIMDEYGGQVSSHPKAKDVVVFSLTCNVNDNPEIMHKMLLIDETSTPRKIIDEKDWKRLDSAEGRLQIPFELLLPIK